MDGTTLIVFGLVYLGMLLGEIPGLALDRAGVALLGAIALVATGRVTVGQAWNAVDVPTLALLLGLMVVSAQFRLGGFYARVGRWLAEHEGPPATLLARDARDRGGLAVAGGAMTRRGALTAPPRAVRRRDARASDARVTSRR